VSLSTLDANFRRDANGPTRLNWFYSIDNVNVFPIGGDITFNSTATNGVAQTQINLSGIADLQNVPSSTTITIVLVIRDSNAFSGEFALGRLAGNDLSIGGTVTTTPTTTWNGSSWDNGAPSIASPAIIDGNYNTGTNGDLSACSLTLNSGANLVVADNTFVEVENDVTTDGSISVQSRGSFVQNDNSASFNLIGSGTSSVTKSTPVKQDWFYYNYWSSPVQNETIGNVFFDVDGDRRFSFNASNYLDSDGDGFDDDNNDWQFALGGETMTPGVGYATTSSRLGVYPSSRTATFTGSFNTGDITTPIAYNPSSTDSWNLIGNPYPSAIDFDAFHASNSNAINGVAYLWSQATPPSSSTPGNQNINLSQNDYATYTVGTGGAAGASGVVPTQFIPSGQGFFVNGISSFFNSVTFTNAMRVADGTSNSQFFSQDTNIAKTGFTLNGAPSEAQKSILEDAGIPIPNDVFLPSQNTGNNNSNENRLWVNLTTDSGVFNQILVGYVNGATNANDGTFYDAPRRVNQNFNAIFYSLINGSEEKYAVQGKAIDAINENETIQLGFSTTIEAETYKFSIAQFKGSFFTDHTVYLKDNLNGSTHNLSNQDYTFTSNSGEFNERFEIVFTQNNTLSTTDLDVNTNAIKITQRDNHIFRFNTNVSTFKSIQIFDISGKSVYRTSLESKLSTKDIQLHALGTALYIAKIEMNDGSSINKKFIVK
jgi:hypothetical protein